MSLPVRQGPLWPGVTKTSKKFSRHLGTVKYNLFLSPLFVSHIYKHKDAEDYNENVVFATGLKARLGSFMLDLHQRREQVKTQIRGRLKQTKASTMKINRAQLDFISADFRAVSARIGGTDSANVQNNDIMSSFQQPTAPADLSRFTIPDHDLNWVDMDDFVELDWILPSESNPKTQILPLAYSPRFSYFRQTDHREVGPEETGFSYFGDEPTHACVMSQHDDPRTVQMELIKERLHALNAQIESHSRLVGEHELQLVRDGTIDEGTRSQYELFLRQGESLQTRKAFLQDGLQRLEEQVASGTNAKGAERRPAPSGASQHSKGPSFRDSRDPEDIGAHMLYASPGDEFTHDFDNRFIIHNIQLKWNNSLRNIILRYIHQNSQRRGFVYYMSRRAVKFILDIVEEQGKSKLRPMDSRRASSARAPDVGDAEKDDDLTVEARIEQLLNDAKRFVNADDAATSDTHHEQSEKQNDIAPDFIAQNSYFLRMIAPQIQLQSEKNKKSVALVTAKGMQLKVVSIRDKGRESDDVSGLVQRRFALDMDSAQFFVATQKTFSSHAHIYCGNRYGNAPGAAWPPWVSLESMFDFDRDPSGLARIIQKTSASLRYDKYNTLRLKYNEKVASGDGERPRDSYANENRIDQISVDFPQVRAICDSSQYYSMYVIVLDLLLYSEPLEQVRNERLEKIMLASDFSDLRGAPEAVSKLQQRIRHLQDIKNLFQIQSKYLDSQGWKDRMAVEKDLATCEDELFFIMKAITTSQRKNEERTKHHSSSGILKWTLSSSEIVWHLMREHGQPLVEFQLRNAAYERTDNTDGSNHNAIEVQRIYGLNLLPNALYPQMIVPYLDEQRQNSQAEDDMMLKVNWYMLEAIGGIPVLDDFEVTLFPLKVQLERELGQRLFEYIFPGVGSNAFENGGFSPFMIKKINPLDNEEDSEEDEDIPTPAASTGSGSPDDSQSSFPGAIEMRLKPTLTLQDSHRSKSPGRRPKIPGFTTMSKDESRKKLGDRSQSATRTPTMSRLPVKKASVDSLRLLGRTQTDRTSATASTATVNDDKQKKFALTRAGTKLADKAESLTDDVSHMMSRASNFMILSHVKINDVVLCLSYKGKGERNIADVYDFVFRLPILEYRNKTWSNLDLALRLKKDAIKALISHAPAILGNKFSHNRPSKQQQKRLRELASSKQVFASDALSNMSPSDGSNSIVSRSSTEQSESPRRSFQSNASPFSGARSMVSSFHSAGPSSALRDSHSARSVNMDGHEDVSVDM